MYPKCDSYQTGFLQVSELHNIYYEQSGNAEGKPVIVLHGGPGGGCPPSYRTYFNPEVYRIVMFDQRGAGQSLPFAGESRVENDEIHLSNTPTELTYTSSVRIKGEHDLGFGK